VVAGEALGTLSEDALARFRGRIRHRLPILSSHPHHDGAGKHRRAAGACGLADATGAPARELAAVGLASGGITIRSNFPAASSSA